MRKKNFSNITSWAVFTVALILFVCNTCFSIFGALDVKATREAIIARGGGGMEFMTTGADVVLIGVCLFSLLGIIFSFVSAKLSKACAVKIISYTLIPLFIILIFICFVLMTS